MASSWGSAWGSAWGNAWGNISALPPVEPPLYEGSAAYWRTTRLHEIALRKKKLRHKRRNDLFLIQGKL